MAYRGVIPADRWHVPYMSGEELRREIAAGVSFTGVDSNGDLVAVMGMQRVREVELVRHAYVLPEVQREGLGGILLRHIIARADRQLLVGTWAAATWAIAFYERNGFTLVDPARKEALLERYWNVPPEQIRVSVVLARPLLEERP